MAKHVSCSLMLSAAHFLLAVGLSTLILPACGQESAASTPALGSKKFAYDVVSIRPNNSGRMVQDRVTPDGYSARNIVLWTLMYHAYYPVIITGDQVVGLPDWARSTRFDVEAKMDADTFAAFEKLSESEQRKLMLQSILADRFQLKVHREVKERSVYELVIAKGGPRLTELKPGESPGGAAMRSGRIDVRGLPIVALAEVLTHTVGRPVVDKTGLTGKYVITIRYRPDELNAPNEDESAPSIFTALQEQLGLKLVPAKAPVNVIVVDHVEKPSPN